jgi:hypothetical protein
MSYEGCLTMDQRSTQATWSFRATQVSIVELVSNGEACLFASLGPTAPHQCAPQWQETDPDVAENLQNVLGLEVPML